MRQWKGQDRPKQDRDPAGKKKKTAFFVFS